MGLQSFKEVLLRKSVGNKVLSAIVQDIGEEFLASQILETLEKMGSVNTSMGSKANGPIVTFASHLDDSDIMQMRDALSHHLSHYRSALKAMYAAPEESKERVELRKVADQHLNHLFPLLHLAARAEGHSNGKLKLDYPKQIPAWETNYTTLARSKKNPKRFHLDPKLLRARPSPGAKKWPEGTGIPDYHYLEMAPHPGHPMVATMPHTGGYPWEEIRIGSPAEVENKQGYLHIEDIPNKKEYAPHPFDFHPIQRVRDLDGDKVSPQTLDKFAEEFANWKTGEQHNKWLNMQEEAYNRDPQAYENRGKTKPKPIYEGIPLLPQLGHVNDPAYPKVERMSASGQSALAELAAITGKEPKSIAATPPAVRPGAVTIRKNPQAAAPNQELESVRAQMAAIKQKFPSTPQTTSAAPATTLPAAPEAAPHPMEQPYQQYMSMKEGDPMREIFHGNPKFMEYLASKKGGNK